MSSAVTFDFHNTLVRCDPWFVLETRTLPQTVLATLIAQDAVPTQTIDVEALQGHYRALRTEIMTHGREMDAVDGSAETFRRAGITVDPALIGPVVNDMFRPLVSTSELVNGAAETIQDLNRQGARLGIVSSAVHHDFLLWCLQHHGLEGFFDSVVTSASAGWYKSDPSIYRHALDELGALPHRSVHVGDSFRFDHLAARSIGMASVWLNEDNSEPQMGALSPDLTLSSLVGSGSAIAYLLHERTSESVAD